MLNKRAEIDVCVPAGSFVWKDAGQNKLFSELSFRDVMELPFSVWHSIVLVYYNG